MRKINTRRFIRATRSTGREINRQIVLNLVRDNGPVSRADLARELGASRGMITSIVNELISDGSVYEGAAAASRRGRKPRMLYVRTRDRLVIAVDVRFSRTYVMLTDFAGTAIALEGFDTITDPDQLVAAIAARARRLLAARAAHDRCEGMGIVVPGVVDHATGRVLNAPQLGWHGVDVRGALSEATGLQVEIENAPIACALAHVWLGQRGAAPTDFVYLAVSDGVGTGIVIDGAVLRGSDSSAGEFGHLPLNLDGPPCLCGARGCLEAYASNVATVLRYLGHDFSPSAARALLQRSGISITDVVARACDGEPRAVAALEETARYLGAGVSAIVNAVNPAQIFIGGEITKAWTLLEPIIRAGVVERAMNPAAASTPIFPEPAGEYPRLRGATALLSAPMFAAPRIA